MKIKKMKLWLVVLCLPFLLTACKSEKFGEGVDRTATRVKVRDIFFKSELMGKTVTVQGIIDSQCQSNGCWFILQDDSGQIYIDLSQNNFILPARTGKKATASGVVSKSQNTYLLVATGVEVQ